MEILFFIVSLELAQGHTWTIDGYKYFDDIIYFHMNFVM